MPLPPEILYQLGAAVVIIYFVYQIIKEIRTIVAKPAAPSVGTREGDSSLTAAGQSVDFWRRANREAAQDAIQATILPILQQQTQILAELRTLATQEVEEHLRLRLASDQLLTGQDKIRANLHNLNERTHAIGVHLNVHAP